ncbi:N-acetylmuramoyl-L-alanine amidase [Rossellomorea vietnamensis]|uniref:N-acetylmuramoyl-L-alanine amidase n=1 Tax=Rossellomorea vietnamensis TaxID=218284 RepID=UPI003CE9A3C4
MGVEEIEVGIDIGHGINTFPPSKGVWEGEVPHAEHTFNSKVAIALDKHLKRHGMKTLMAQKPFQNDVPLTTRTKLYNSRGVKLLVSVHANWSRYKTAKGVAAFYWYKDAPNSKRAAELYEDEARKAGLPLWGGARPSVAGDWSEMHMCREPKMASILTENGFMSNPEEFKKIFKDQDYVEVIAEVHARAVCRYFNVKYKEVVKTQSKEEPKVVEKAIVLHSEDDLLAAKLLINKLGCALYLSKSIYRKSGDKVKHMYIIGGNKEGVKADKITLISGVDRVETINKLVDQHL